MTKRDPNIQYHAAMPAGPVRAQCPALMPESTTKGETPRRRVEGKETRHGISLPPKQLLARDLFSRGKRYRYSLDTGSKRVAQDKLKQIEYELTIGRHNAPRKTPFPAFLGEFLAHLKSSTSFRHYRNRRSQLRQVSLLHRAGSKTD